MNLRLSESVHVKEFCFFGVRALDETHSTSVNTGLYPVFLVER